MTPSKKEEEEVEEEEVEDVEGEEEEVDLFVSLFICIGLSRQLHNQGHIMAIKYEFIGLLTQFFFS